MILGSVGVKLAVKAEQDIYELRNKQTSKQKTILRGTLRQ